MRKLKKYDAKFYTKAGELVLPVLQSGVFQFTIGGNDILWREVEGLGFQWFRGTDKTWQKLVIDESDLKKVAFKTHERQGTD